MEESSFQLSDEQKNRLAHRLSFKQPDRTDRGQILPLTAEALRMSSDADAGAAQLEALVDALKSERVIVPISVEKEAHQGNHGDIDFVRVPTPAGETLAVYSSANSLSEERPKARPMSTNFRTVALTALVETGGRVMMDPGGVGIVIPRPAVAALAQGDSWLPAWKDTELLNLLREIAGVERGGGSVVQNIHMSYAGGGVVRLNILLDSSQRMSCTRGEVGDIVTALGGNTRLLTSADRIEIVPRWV